MRASATEARRQRRTERARKGGLATLEKYGVEHYRRIGRLGGRSTWQQELAKVGAEESGRKATSARPGRPRNARPYAGES